MTTLRKNALVEIASEENGLEINRLEECEFLAGECSRRAVLHSGDTTKETASVAASGVGHAVLRTWQRHRRQHYCQEHNIPILIKTARSDNGL